MKITNGRFTVPNCILDDGLSPPAIMLLLFLFRCSDIGGRCSPGYAEIKEGAQLVSDATVSRALKELQTHGWFHFIKKGGGKKAVYWLRIPTKYAPDEQLSPSPKIMEMPRKYGR